MTIEQPSLQERKAQLRIEMRARRQEKSRQNPNDFKLLAERFKAEVKLEAGAVVAAYSAFQDEMDCVVVIEALRAQGHKIALPVIIGKGLPLEFRLVEPQAVLGAHRMGMLEPGPDAPVVSPDVVLVPLLAFDRNRHRLGYGGGFYDRTIIALRAVKPVLAIGVGYGWQEVPVVPVGPHDIALDKIVTDVNIF